MSVRRVSVMCGQTGLYVTEVGDALQLKPNIIYISTDGRHSWTELHNFVHVCPSLVWHSDAQS